MSNPTLVHGKRQSLGKTIWKHRASYLLMAPYFILFFFFTVLPVLMAIGVSFTDWNMLEKPEFVGRSEERRVGKECRSRWSPYH